MALAGKAQWYRRGSDPLPADCWHEIPRSQRFSVSVSVAVLQGDIFYELTDKSVVESISKDGTKVRVRNLKTDRRSVFHIHDVEILEKHRHAHG